MIDGGEVTEMSFGTLKGGEERKAMDLHKEWGTIRNSFYTWAEPGYGSTLYAYNRMYLASESAVLPEAGLKWISRRYWDLTERIRMFRGWQWIMVFSNQISYTSIPVQTELLLYKGRAWARVFKAGKFEACMWIESVAWTAECPKRFIELPS